MMGGVTTHTSEDIDIYNYMQKIVAMAHAQPVGARLSRVAPPS